MYTHRARAHKNTQTHTLRACARTQQRLLHLRRPCAHAPGPSQGLCIRACGCQFAQLVGPADCSARACCWLHLQHGLQQYRAAGGTAWSLNWSAKGQLTCIGRPREGEMGGGSNQWTLFFHACCLISNVAAATERAGTHASSPCCSWFYRALAHAFCASRCLHWNCTVADAQQASMGRICWRRTGQVVHVGNSRY